MNLMKCKNCGKEVNRNDSVCKYCGNSLNQNTINNDNQINKKKKSNIIRSIIFLVIGFIFGVSLVVFKDIKQFNDKGNNDIVENVNKNDEIENDTKDNLNEDIIDNNIKQETNKEVENKGQENNRPTNKKPSSNNSNTSNNNDKTNDNTIKDETREEELPQKNIQDSDSNKENNSNDSLVKIDIYYSETCHHCHNLFNFLDNLDEDIKSKLIITKYSIDEYDKEYNEAVDKFSGNVGRGVPYTVFNNQKAIMGYSVEMEEKYFKYIDEFSK